MSELFAQLPPEARAAIVEHNEIAARRAKDPLDGMTQARWSALTGPERQRIVDLSGLHPRLRGHEGWRVEIAVDGETRRFIVGRTNGWRPAHMAIKRRDSCSSSDLISAGLDIASVRRIERIR